MQINDIRKELENILLLFHKYEDTDYNDFVENEIFNTEWKPNSLRQLKKFQKELNAQRKGYKSESSKLWAKKLYTAVRDYNKCFVSTDKPNLTYQIPDNSLPGRPQMVAEDIPPYGDIPSDIKKTKEENYSIEELTDEKLLTRSNFDRLAIHIPTLKENYLCILSVVNNIKASIDTLVLCEKDTTLPLPSNYKIRKTKFHDLTIRTYTRYKYLSLISVDHDMIHEIIELLISVKESQNEKDTGIPIIDDDNNIEAGYTIRRVSTGSYEIFLTTILPAAPAIAGFIFLIIKEIQKTKQRHLDMKMKEKELNQNEMKITSQIINDAAKILSVDPENQIYRNLIHQAGLHTLEYLRRNPHGSINGQEYIIQETPAPPAIEETINNGEE